MHIVLTLSDGFPERREDFHALNVSTSILARVTVSADVITGTLKAGYPTNGKLPAALPEWQRRQVLVLRP
jgi:hypothetical protein